MVEGDFFSSPQPLGRPIPLDEHAVSVSLPTWADVVGYEEGHKRVTDKMKIGYPRFKVHACIEKLIGITKLRHGISSEQECMILPTLHVATAFSDFLKCSDGVSLVKIIHIGFQDMHAVAYPVVLKGQGRKFWQHTGEIVSSRQVEESLLSMESDSTASDWAVTTSHNEEGKRLSASDALMTEFKDREKARRVFHSDSPSSASKNEKAILDSVLDIIKCRISSIIHEPPQQITLCVSGMAAIYGALKCVQQLDKQNGNAPGKIVVFGFPYLDTLKLMQLKELNPAGCTFFGSGDGADLDTLESSLMAHHAQHTGGGEPNQGIGPGPGPTGGVSAVFTEFPSNPLLKCPDLRRLTSLAKRFNFLLVVDDTIGNFSNVDLFHSKGVRADIVCSSLTKIFSGRGDVLAGSIVINSHYALFPSSTDTPVIATVADKGSHDSHSSTSSKSKSTPTAVESECREHDTSAAARALLLNSIVQTLDLPPLYIADAVTLEKNSRDFLARCRLVSTNGKELAEWLTAHECVQALYYSSGDVYESVMRRAEGTDSVSTDAGYGCLMSIVLKVGLDEKAFFDALEIAKGPSLGTNFTIACPYTLLAHYTELEWAAGFGVDGRLIRVSVGMEDIQILKDVFSRALLCSQHAVEKSALPAKL